jgi:hypothetical protein
MHAEPPAFASIVAELEEKAGRRLRGDGRSRCLRAFEESADGFHRVALSAGRRARTNPLGLLCAMVDDGEHTLGATMRAPGNCFVCGTYAPDALRRRGQYWCADHETGAT